MRASFVRDGALRTVDGPEAAAHALGDPTIAGTVWIDADRDEPGLGGFLAEVLHLHALAVEDILEAQATPKLEDYGDVLYIVGHAVAGRPESFDALVTTEVDVVVSSRWVFTHHHGSAAIESTLAHLRKRPAPFARGPAFVAHAILDHLVDEYLPLIDAVDDEVEQLQASVIAKPAQDLLARVLLLKRLLQRFRRMSVYQREVLHRLTRGELDVIPAEALPFYRDVYDHFLRVSDLADSYREQVANTLDAYLSSASNRLNDVMKTLTVMATVFMPMTFVVGVYGMNFEYMPELHWRFGYLGVWAVLVVIPVAMVILFRRRGWL